VAFAVGFAALVIVFRRWSTMPTERSTSEDRVLVDAALRADGDDSETYDEHGEGASR
jgi:hypothetical protein